MKKLIIILLFVTLPLWGIPYVLVGAFKEIYKDIKIWVNKYPKDHNLKT